MNRRTWIRSTLGTGSAALIAAPFLGWQFDRDVPMVIYKSPTCGCCQKWVDHVAANGFATEVHDRDDVTPVKQEHGVPGKLYSCHTALVAGYVIEGHVPADLIHRLLKDKPDFAGLSAPGMPQSAPGMDIGNQPYDIIAFDKKGRSFLYAKR